MSKSIIKYDEIDINKIVFTKLEDSDRIKSQKLCYVKYKIDDKDQQLKIKTPEFDFETYGLPREGPYYPDAKSRAFFKFPFCHVRKQYEVDYDAIEVFYNKLVEIDQMCDTDEFRQKIFGDKNYNQYAYQPIIRTPEIDEEVQDDKKQSYRPPYTKIKIDLEYSNDPENQSTKPQIEIFEKKEDTRVNVSISTFDDLVSFVKFRSKLRFVINFSKLYAMKTKVGMEKKKYGIILKLTHMEIQRPNTNSYNKSIDPFNDDFDDINEENKINNSSNKANVSIKPKVHKLDLSDESEDEEDVDEIEDVKELKFKKK